MLIVGGYLVLDRDYKGIVITVSSRFYVHVGPILDYGSQINLSDEIPVTIESLQFHSCRRFTLIMNRSNEPGETTTRTFPQLIPSDTNFQPDHYIDDTIIHTLRVVTVWYDQQRQRRRHDDGDNGLDDDDSLNNQGIERLWNGKMSRGLRISLVGDNDFYSQNEQASFELSYNDM